MIYLIIGWRILHVVTTGQACPNLPCDVVFDPEEWQAAWTVKYRQKPPQQPPKLGDMIRIIAGFGGFLGRKSDGFPGAKTLWEGMEKVRHYALGIVAVEPFMLTLIELWVIVLVLSHSRR